MIGLLTRVCHRPSICATSVPKARISAMRSPPRIFSADYYIAVQPVKAAPHGSAWAGVLHYQRDKYRVVAPTSAATARYCAPAQLDLGCTAAAVASLSEFLPWRLRHLDIYVSEAEVARFGNNELRYEFVSDPVLRRCAQLLSFSLYWIHNRRVTTRFVVRQPELCPEMATARDLALEARHCDEFGWIKL